MRDYLNTGYEAEIQCRLADALNNYYWALLLLRSHPDNQTLRGAIGPGEPTTLISAIPDRIRQLFSNTTFVVQSAPYNAQEKVRRVRVKTMILNGNISPDSSLYSLWCCKQPVPK